MQSVDPIASCGSFATIALLIASVEECLDTAPPAHYGVSGVWKPHADKRLIRSKQGYLAKFGWTHPDYRTFLGEPAEFTRVSLILHNAAAGHGRDLIQLGLLLLITTPIARVAVSVLVFLVEKDWLYV